MTAVAAIVKVVGINVSCGGEGNDLYPNFGSI